MNIQKLITRKKYLLAVRTEDYTVILNHKGEYSIHSSSSDGCIDPLDDKNNCSDLLKKLVEFDEQPFLNALEKYKYDREQTRIRLMEEARVKEENRLKEMMDGIIKSETPSELANEFRLDLIETGSHWSDLYEGRSSFAFVINDRLEAEIVSKAMEYWDVDCEFGEAKNRGGEHHWTFGKGWYGDDLESYQDACKTHFNGDHYFYKSQDESEAEYYITEIISRILEDDSLDYLEKIKDIKSAIDTFEEIEDGYYDCNGSMMISDETLNDPDFSGYSEDVYTYKFACKLPFKNKWKEEIEEEEEEN